MRFAIISDIHGNLEALKSVLEDIKTRSVDKIFCLGDIIGKGFHSHECVQLVRKNCNVVVMGNVDERYTSNSEDFNHCKYEQERINFNRSLLEEDDIKYIRSLPYSYEFYLSGNLVRMFHSDPNDVYNLTSNYDLDLQKQLALFKAGNYTISSEMADVVIFGHVHYQFLEKIFNRTLVNCGSVGCSGCLIYDEKLNAEPSEMGQAHYLILDGNLNSKKLDSLGFDFRSVSYDKQKELSTGKNNIDYELYEAEILKGKYRGIDKAVEKLKEQGWKF